MNIDINVIKILCFGDSNTWGQIPGETKVVRFPQMIRWTGILQQKFGNSFKIIEEGLSGRTTNIDDTKHEGKNGLSYLKPCLQSQTPLDLVILFLGTCDLKARYQRYPQEIGEAVQILINTIINPEYSELKIPKILLVSPAFVDETVLSVKEKYLGAEEKSKQFSKIYSQIAVKNHLFFLDLAKIVNPSKKDGYHLDEKAHKIIADNLYELISKITL